MSERGGGLSFSIVMPTYDRREVVTGAVRALGEIAFDGPFELIVVVDGSTDGTAAALSALECPHPLRVIEQENRGAAAARNRGAREAAGDILLFLDDDMVCSPDILHHHARAYDTGADAVLGDMPLHPDSPRGFLSRAVGDWARQRTETLSAGTPLTLFDLLTGHLSVRRSVFEELGGFDESFTAQGSFGNEDLDFGTRLVEGHEVRFVAEAVSFQRYVVRPRQHLRQWSDAGRADVAFARKHPALAREIFALHGARKASVRFVVRPLSAIPGFAALAARIAAPLADRFPDDGTIPGKVAARLFFLVRGAVYWAGVRAAGGMPVSARALVLCYHAIADLRGDPVLADYGIVPATFRNQLATLDRLGFTFISAGELAASLAGISGLPRRAVLLTFDDCYAELPAIARAELAPRKIPAIAFAVSGLTSNRWDQAIGARALPLLDAAGLQELRTAGVEIGCHSRTHRSLPELGDRALAEETGGAADDLARTGLPRPRAFAFPYGERDERSREALRAAGYDIAFGLGGGRVGRRSDPLDLPRVEILARDAGWRFRAKTALPTLSKAFLR